MAKTKKGAPVEPLAKRAARLVRLAPRARKVAGVDWSFDGRTECSYLGETLISLASTFENQDAVLDFIEAATPEVVKALALKALALDLLREDLASVPLDGLRPETLAALRKAQ